MRQYSLLKSALCWFLITGGAVSDWAAGERPETAVSNIVLTAIARVNERFKLQIDYPAAFSNRLDIYVSTNLQAGSWALWDTNLATIGTTTLAWTESDAACSGPRFYRVGNADLDSDLDGLADARETLVYLTNPLMPDSDLDGIPDGAELRRGTDPVAGGSAAITLYADSDAGSDGFDGIAPVVSGGHGPKRSLSAASAASYSRDVIQVRGHGVFREPSLCIGSSDVRLRPLGAVEVQP